ncbi:hypothetical protein ACUUL3_06075 [Thiovibrio sp. JS02]
MPKKKIFKITAILLLATLSLALVLPRLFNLEGLRAHLARGLASRLESTVRFERLQWHWLPLPHVTLVDCRFENDDLLLRLPRAEVYPNWRALLGNELRAGKVVLHTPEITVKRFPEATGIRIEEQLPGVAVEVKNGLLHVKAPSPWPQLQNREFALRELQGRASVSPAGIDFSLEGKPTFGERFRVSGGIGRGDGRYRMEFDCRKFKLHEVLVSLADKELVPVESLLNITGKVEGQGLDSVQARITGDLPCLLVFPTDKKILLNCGFVDLGFEKNAADLRLTINEFEMKEPGLSLTGTVSRSVASLEQDEPIWDIALTAADLNLTQIRDSVLAMWGNNEIARGVGGIVLSGKAGKAGYAFHGRVADFKDVRNMEISAEEIDASIRIPVGDLVLTNTRGRMLIKDGKLRVNGDSAKLGNSNGRNCNLVLGLPEDDDSFFLDVDLDADLAELPGVLARLIDDQAFLAELAKFDKVSGSARGRLHIEDSLDNIKVTVAVSDMRGNAEYAPLNWGFAVESGSMTIAPHRVTWQDVKGEYGPHLIQRTSGEVDWHKEALLSVRRLDAAIFAPDLQAGALSFWKNLDAVIARHAQSLDGTIGISQTTISGRMAEPDSWTGSAALNFDGLRVKTPYLPEAVRIKEGSGLLSDKTLVVSRCRASLFDDTFSVRADLRHEDLAALQGTITADGTVGERFGAWLREQDFVKNKALFPRLPLRVSSLALELGGEKTVGRGVVAAGEKGPALPRVEFSAESNTADPLHLSLHVVGEGEEASIGVDFLDNIPETFLFTWAGSLSENTVDRLLADETLLDGAISGDFQLYLPHDPNKIAFSGTLTGEGFRWFLANGTGRSVAIDDIRLEGVGNELKVKKLACALSDQESIQASGVLSRADTGLELTLDLASRFLSRQTVFNFLEDLKGLKDGHPLADRKREADDKEWNLTGTINFDLAEFISVANGGAEPKSIVPTLTWQPLQGEIRIHPGGKLSASITSGRLCCLSTTGQWFSSPELGSNTFQLLSADCDTPPRFERVLPCLGYPQDLIEGAFSLEGSLSGPLNNWQDGYLDVNSRAGRILRMKLLAKIFSVINVTDLFTPVPEGSEGGSGAGFPYSELILKSHVRNNELIIDEAVVRGEGLNLFARGKMNIVSLDMDFVVLISPFKTLDAIISKVPLVGRVIGGETATLVTFPVAVRGPARDPEVTLLPPSAVGEGIINIIKRTILLPFTILSPILPDAAPDEGGR